MVSLEAGALLAVCCILDTHTALALHSLDGAAFGVAQHTTLTEAHALAFVADSNCCSPALADSFDTDLMHDADILQGMVDCSQLLASVDERQLAHSMGQSLKHRSTVGLNHPNRGKSLQSVEKVPAAICGEVLLAVTRRERTVFRRTGSEVQNLVL